MGFELSFDNFHKKGDRIFRVVTENNLQGGRVEKLPKTYSAVGPTVKANLPEVEQQTRVAKLEGLVSHKQKDGTTIAFNEHNIYSVDPSFLTIFSFPMISGGAEALKLPGSIVITQSIANRYFPDQNPIGQSIRIQQQESGTDYFVTVTGVCSDVPGNSHLQFDFLVSSDLKGGDWTYADYYTYLLLAPHANLRAFENRLYDFTNKIKTGLKQNNSPTMGKSNLSSIRFYLQPLKKIHLYSNLSQEIGVSGNSKLVWGLGVVAFVILLLAYLNYVNLVTAKAIDRAKEVGLRAILGSGRKQLILQFVFESLFVNIIAFCLAVVLSIIAWPGFISLCGVPISFSLWDYHLLGLCFVFTMIIGTVVSSLYPALILTSHRAAAILKGKLHFSNRSVMFRKGLVAFQFMATVFFLMVTFIVYKQLKFMKDAHSGMDISQTLVVPAPTNVRSTQADAELFASRDSLFLTEALRNPQIQSISASSTIPGEYNNYIMSYKNRSLTDDSKGIRLATFEIQSNFLKQFNCKVIAGEPFSEIQQSDKAPMLLNEASVAALGFKSPKDAVGGIVETRNGQGRIFENEVIGVVADFHQTSLRDNYTPTIFRLLDPSSVKYYELKISTTDLNKTIEYLNNTYRSTFPAAAFEYFFLDEYFNRQYKEEQQFGKVFSLLAGCAIFIASLGLFGLTLITIRQRIKEVAIRKVLGASIINILALLYKDFLQLIIVATIVALPLAYLEGNNWLANYQFKAKLGVEVFTLPVLIVFVLAMATISFQIVKTAVINPVRSLKTE